MLWWKTLSKRDHLGDPGVDGKIILRLVFMEVGCGGVDWIELIEHRDKWQALFNAVMNLRVP